jgi:acyl carrier protein
MKNEIFEELKNFVVKQSCVDDEVITDKTKIEDDLGVSGADGVEFIVAYGREFNVDVSGFMAADYFSPEGGGVLSTLIKTLIGGKDESSEKILTVGHLLKGVQAGRLDEEVINS